MVGPSHDNGGIPVVVDGVEPIEVEGGEFIINKQTVDAVGEDFLHKLNSTETTHHRGGRTRPVARNARRKMLRSGGNISRGVKKYPHGGMHMPGSSHHTNAAYGACKMHSSDVTSCNSTPGCHYDYSMERCVG